MENLGGGLQIRFILTPFQIIRNDTPSDFSTANTTHGRTGFPAPVDGNRR